MSCEGADTVTIIRSATSKRFLDLKVLEILAKPRADYPIMPEFTWMDQATSQDVRFDITLIYEILKGER